MAIESLLNRFRRPKPESGSRYPYRPLDSAVDELRLLTVLPGRPGKPVRCKIQHARLDNKPAYETISYVWGDDTMRGHIKMDDISLSVPASTESAIRAVRHFREPRIIWIDAVCINQEDLDERSQQVAMMRNIYAHSRGNLIQLGDSDTAQAALESVNNIVEEFRQQTGDFKHLAGIVSSPGSTLTFAKSRPSASINEQALMTLVAHPWFTRLWVVQEAYNAPSNTCFYDSTRFPLVDILRACVWLTYNQSFYLGITAYGPALHGNHYLWHYFDKEHGTYRDSGFLITDALHHASTRACHDPRDKVFAVLGILRRTLDRQAIPSQLVPDYRKPLHEVIRDATRYAITSERNVSDVLRSVYHSPVHVLRIQDWPTWVPQCYIYGVDQHHPEYLYRVLEVGDPAIEHRVFDQNKLQLKGLTLGVVHQQTRGVMSRQQGHGVTKDTERMWLVEALTLLTRAKRCARSEITMFTLAQLLLAGTDIDGQALRDTSYGMEEFLHETFHEDLCQDESGAWQWKPSPRAGTTAIPTKYCFEQVCLGRRLFSTGTGNCGIGPAAMKPGDVVAIFRGVRHPYILRKVDDCYMLVGHCYVQEAQEAYDRHQVEGREDEVFDLR